jgi:predicted nucleic acid-binding protein
MPVLDTNILIEKIRRNEEIRENITEVTVLEYPPVLKYLKFYGKIYYLRRPLNLALKNTDRLEEIRYSKIDPRHSHCIYTY